jgi:hypothetical protein
MAEIIHEQGDVGAMDVEDENGSNQTSASVFRQRAREEMAKY